MTIVLSHNPSTSQRSGITIVREALFGSCGGTIGWYFIRADMKLQPGHSVPHIQVRTVTGDVFSYATIWQRKNFVLAVVGGSPADESYAAALNARASEFRDHESECVVTRDEVPGLEAPAVLIADKWAEIVHITDAADAASLPDPDDLLEWVDYVRRRCPECEGEAY